MNQFWLCGHKVPPTNSPLFTCHMHTAYPNLASNTSMFTSNTANATLMNNACVSIIYSQAVPSQKLFYELAVPLSDSL